MSDLLNNPWAIGVGGGVISGVIVFLITSKLFTKRDDKEYLQKLNIANKEILYSIRPLIVGQKVPDKSIVDSIIFSTAKKYSVKIIDLYNNTDIAEDLTKEILDNSFLDSDSKLKYCEFTAQLRDLDVKQMQREGKREVIYLEGTKPISKEFFSLTLALMTSATVFVSVAFLGKEKTELFSMNEYPDVFLLISVLTLLPVAALMASKILKILNDKDKLDKKNQDGAEGRSKNDPNISV